ncbi:MAG: methyl-accepting chemotaxis protein [Chloroflexota bacterium]|nr:methyl-accepting chemotaxis protein [Chloroflexota bacterium]
MMEYLILASIVVGGCILIAGVIYARFKMTLLSRIVFFMLPGIAVTVIAGFVLGKLGMLLTNAAIIVPIGLVTWFAVIASLARGIARPLGKMTALVDAIAIGRLDLELETSERKDELGQLARSVRKMLESTKDKTHAAAEIAKGNLGVELQVVSEEDVLGRAMVTMKENIAALLQEQEETAHFFEGTINSIGDMILTTDSEFRVNMVNPALEKLLGFKKEEVMGKAVAETPFLPRGTAINLGDTLADLGRGGVRTSESELAHKDGRMIPFLTSMGMMTDADGTALGIVVVGKDITETKSLIQEQENLLQEQEEQREYLEGEVNKLVTGMEALSQGDLTVSFTAQRQDDVGRLVNASNALVVSLHDLIGQVAGSANHVSAASGKLSSAAEQAGEAAQQIATTIQQVASGTAQQTESVTKTAVSVEELSRAIDGVARGAQEQASAVARSSQATAQISAAVQQVAANAQAGAEGSAEATQAARAGADTVEETVKGMKSIKDKVGLSAQRVREMGQRSNEVGAIVETIDDIASQTNLLALNAAIEAARAGEHGKGFAVVADEVRKLAEKSAEATKEIAGLIKGIQETVGEAVQAMNESATEVDVGADRANDAGQALQSILKAAEAVNQQVAEIASAAQQMSASSSELVNEMDAVSAVVEENTASTEEMAASSGQVSQAVENIASISEENSAAAEEVSAAVEEMSAQIQEVSASAQSLNGMAQTLRTVVAQFRLTTGETQATPVQAAQTTAPALVPVAPGGGDGHGYERPGGL